MYWSYIVIVEGTINLFMCLALIVHLMDLLFSKKAKVANMPIDSTFDNSNAHINLIEDGSPKTSSNPQ